MNEALRQWETQNKHVLLPPNTAWPTVVLFLCAVLLFVLSTYACYQGMLSFSSAIIANTISQFMLFTVLHDASHRAVSQKPWLNESLGSIAAFFISPIGGIRLFRFVHMQHHRFTNEGGKQDPDEWCGKGTIWTLPLRWFTLDLHYVVWYLNKWSTRPRKERIELFITCTLGLSIIFSLSFKGFFLWIFWLWLIPSRLSTAWLAIAFDYLPHYPHDVMAKDNPMRATNLKPHFSFIMTPLFLCQNHHLIHHLYPRIPFYRYPWVWCAAQNELISAGARIMSWKNQELKLK